MEVVISQFTALVIDCMSNTIRGSDFEYLVVYSNGGSLSLVRTSEIRDLHIWKTQIISDFKDVFCSWI